MEILWLTENYTPNRGGMAQSCDRIVRSLRNSSITVHIIHFTNRKKPFFTEKKINGTYTAIPLSNDVSHTLNLCLNFLTNPDRPFIFSKITAFGGVIPLSGGPIFSKLFDAELFTFIRGNDFDISIFDPRKKYNLDQAFKSSKAICVNALDKAYKIKKLFKFQNIHYTPNGIDIEEWLPLKSEIKFASTFKKENISENKTIFGLFGDLKVKKGINFFIESIILSGKKDNIHLLFTGDIDIEAVELLEKHEISCSYLPFMDRNELSKYYKICDWICIPSFYDGMPNVLLEAGSLGIPVIASNIDGMKDIITNKKTGLLFHPSDKKGCTSQIFNALALPKKTVKEYGKNLKEQVEKNYTIEKECENYINVFNGVLEKTLIEI